MTRHVLVDDLTPRDWTGPNVEVLTDRIDPEMTATGKAYALSWGPLTREELRTALGDDTETGTCTTALLTLTDLRNGDTLGGMTLLVRDDDPDAEDKLNSAPAYQEIENRLLTLHHLERVQVDFITEEW
jgi:hypothetical protein